MSCGSPVASAVMMAVMICGMAAASVGRLATMPCRSPSSSVRPALMSCGAAAMRLVARVVTRVTAIGMSTGRWEDRLVTMVSMSSVPTETSDGSAVVMPWSTISMM